MERIAYVIIIGLLVFVAIQMTTTVDKSGDQEYVGTVEKGECTTCSLTSLEPKQVCPSGMCSMKGRTGCRL